MGDNIVLFDDLRQIPDHTKNVSECGMIVQRYIANPLLLSGYKFDLRMYVVVTGT